MVVGVGCWDRDCERFVWPSFVPFRSENYVSYSLMTGSFLERYPLVKFTLVRLGGNTSVCGSLTKDNGDALLF